MSDRTSIRRTCITCDEPLEKSDPSESCYACETEHSILSDSWSFVDDEFSMYDGLDF